MSLKIDIKKQFKNFKLNLNFDSKGAPLGVLGASGSGKSVMLKCIAGIEVPDSGKIELNGKVLFDSTKKINIIPQKRNIGYLFQNYALFPNMTVTENIACALRADKSKSYINNLLNRFKLTGFEAHYPYQLSGGQQQRVALARILAYEPEALLLDEPFSALDAHLKEMLQIDLQHLLNDYSGDIILVTHNRDEVYKLCKELLVLKNGHVVEIGNMQSVFQNPLHIHAAKLTGCKNFSRARQINSKEILALDWGCVLTVDNNIPADITHIGVRAHCFYPSSIKKTNAIPVRICERLEAPFEWDVIFKNAQSECNCHKIWWKYKKENKTLEDPEYLCVDPKDILLLKDEYSKVKNNVTIQ